MSKPKAGEMEDSLTQEKYYLYREITRVAKEYLEENGPTDPLTLKKHVRENVEDCTQKDILTCLVRSALFRRDLFKRWSLYNQNRGVDVYVGP